MGRNRVLSFMSQFSAGTKTPPRSASPPDDAPYTPRKSHSNDPFPDHNIDLTRTITPEYGSSVEGSPVNSPRSRSNSRPLSMVLPHQPPLMDINEDTIPELQPVFTFLNSHSNKLYQEGYFLKLDDQNTQGKANPDRTWTECFAQLVGTVLSLWDAAELDAAGEDGEVLPKFINLTDASIKMIESLPTRSADEQPLQNILSISTAGRNRYLLHFNSHHSLIQWTSGIRLAMYEHSTLQEAYTGALIAGKAKTLNNINLIMDRSRFKTEEWVRVRFGAGVPWRRCWCVITPPDEKEYAKLQKELKKRSPYDRSPVPTLKGDIKFYDTRSTGKKQKKAQPIASITDAYSAYAIYPQAKSLIDASTLLKVEGSIQIHTDPPSSTEGFVFIMPETHPAVSGFEMLLRFLFPTWDTFGLYGRPGRLVASVLDPRSLMFAMPKHKRYGYMELLDVSNLILADGSSSWNEKEWRKRLKEATGTRMNAIEDAPSPRSRSGSQKSSNSRSSSGHRVGFSDEPTPVRSSRSFSLNGPARTDSGTPDQRNGQQHTRFGGQANHSRNLSDPHAPSNQSYGGSYAASPQSKLALRTAFPDRSNSDDDRSPASPAPLKDLDGMRKMQTPEPVSKPPAFNHSPQARPVSKVYHSSDQRWASNRLSSSTLAQLATAGGLTAPNNNSDPSMRNIKEEPMGSGPSVLSHANPVGISANDNASREVLSPPNQNQQTAAVPPLNLAKQRSHSPLTPGQYAPPSPYGSRGPSPNPRSGLNSRPPTADSARPPMPPGQMPPNRPPRGPNPNYRPDQAMGPRGPGPMPDGRRTPNYRGPPGPHGPPGPPRPPPHGSDQYRQNSRPGPPRSPGPPGPRGPPGPPPPHGMTHRKPLPERIGNTENPKFSTMSASSAITTNEIIDHYAYDQGRPREPQQGSYNPEPRSAPGQRRGTGQSSAYDDDSSIDYASTHKSDETPSTVEKPRAGVLKTVGGNEADGMTPANYNIPEINFGPTVNYGATQTRSKTPDPLGPGEAPQPHSPVERRPVPSQQKSSPGPAYGRKDSEDALKRTMAWQPAGNSPSPGAQGSGLSAEQYVQKKAAHARTSSANTLGGFQSTTPSPGTKRRSSYGMLQSHSRSNSADLLSRPGSRGAGSALNLNSSGEMSSQLSAKEREHVARVTGTPLLNVTGNQQRQNPQGPGLVGTIEARERERQQMRQGANSQAVQNAINQRQHQQAAMAYQQQMNQQQMAQQQMAQQQMAQQQMANQQMIQQQAYQQQLMAERSMSPQVMYNNNNNNNNAMGRGGYGGPQMGGSGPSFSRPLRSAPQQVDPRFIPPQGQYGPAPGSQQGSRNVHPQYQGQAF